MRRRDALLALLAAGFVPAADSAPRRIAVLARKFEFVPAEIALTQGETVTLVVTGDDFVHGFALPDFGLRHDVVPGRALEVTITPRKPGRFHFLCDNFCGEGHDRMSGILAVRQSGGGAS